MVKRKKTTRTRKTRSSEAETGELTLPRLPVPRALMRPVYGTVLDSQGALCYNAIQGELELNRERT
jgi:hypothetical protein